MIRNSLEKSRCLIAIALVIAALTWFLGFKGKKGSAAGGTND
jgi:hypothetical protein